MSTLGDLPAAAITTRQVSALLLAVQDGGASPRTVNKHRQVLSAIFNHGRREDTFALPANPAEATTKRREPPPAVLDFYEPEEVEQLASVAAAGAHRGPQPADLEAGEIEWRAREDAQDAELFRIAAFTGLRLGERLALRWEDVDIDARRLVVQRAVSAGIEGPPRTGRRVSFRSPIRRPTRSGGCSRAGTTPSATTTCSAHGWDDGWTARRCAVASSAPVMPPAFARFAFTRSVTRLEVSSRAMLTHASCRGSSDTRGSRPPSATCMRRRARRMWSA
jgi:integrase